MSKPKTCLRCKNELPANSGFCPACGMTNDSDAVSRGIKTEKKFEARIKQQRFWNKVNTFFWFWGR